MNTENVKAVLRVLRRLEKLAEQLDALIYKRAMCTDMRLENCACNCAERQVERILELMRRKRSLVLLKLTADEQLERMDEASACVLKMRYVDGKRKKEICAALGVSERTYFRRLEKAYLSFGRKMRLAGYDDGWFEEFRGEWD